MVGLYLISAPNLCRTMCSVRASGHVASCRLLMTSYSPQYEGFTTPNGENDSSKVDIKEALPHCLLWVQSYTTVNPMLYTDLHGSCKSASTAKPPRTKGEPQQTNRRKKKKKNIKLKKTHTNNTHNKEHNIKTQQQKHTKHIKIEKAIPKDRSQKECQTSSSS